VPEVGSRRERRESAETKEGRLGHQTRTSHCIFVIGIGKEDSREGRLNFSAHTVLYFSCTEERVYFTTTRQSRQSLGSPASKVV
jgi:hypothetical protein